jgi:predicted transcriptional regulator
MTKLARLRALIASDDGASIDELVKTLAWQRHTIRAALTRLRQRGIAINRARDESGGSRYRVGPPSP